MANSNRRITSLVLAAGCLLAVTSARAARPAPPLEDIGDDDTGGGGGGGPTNAFGLGLILGEPSGLTAKVFFAKYNGVQAHLGYGLGKRGRLVIAVDYLFHFMDAVPPVARAGRLVPYVGVGGRLGARDEDPVLGVRIPVGASFLIRGAPFELFLELALGVGLIPETQELIDGGLGARFYF